MIQKNPAAECKSIRAHRRFSVDRANGLRLTGSAVRLNFGTLGNITRL
jgi:hypothetical protein